MHGTTGMTYIIYSPQSTIVLIFCETLVYSYNYSLAYVFFLYLNFGKTMANCNYFALALILQLVMKILMLGIYPLEMGLRQTGRKLPT